MSGHPTGALATALQGCGVDPLQVTIVWDDLCEEDELTFPGAALSGETLRLLADLYLTFPCRFRFETDDLQKAFKRALRAAPAMIERTAEIQGKRRALLEEKGLAAFAAYDPASEDLEDFARRVEADCGLRSGDLFSVRGGKAIYVVPGAPD